MMTSFKNLTLVLLPIVTLLLGVQIGIAQEAQRFTNMEQLFSNRTESGALITDPEKEVDISLLWSVWKLMTKYYIAPEKLQTQPLLYGAIEGLVNAVGDPYTLFMPPQENKEFRQSLNGTLQGIGAELTQRENNIVVVAPLKGSPAEKAGLLPQDIITQVDSKSIEGFSLGDAVERIRGPKGSTVILTVTRKERETVDISIVRDEITVPSVEAEIKEFDGKRFGYIALNRFGDTTTQEFGSSVRNQISDNIDGMIIDVRFNGGGYLDTAIDLSSMFLKKGKIVSVAHRQGEPTHHYVKGNPIAGDIPLVILINEGSASASEILAGALQDNQRATVIGKQSFGKGTVQEVFDLAGGTSIRITTARWLTPNGKDLGKEGVHPDIEVDRTMEQIQAEQDPQLDAALEFLSRERS